MSLVDTNIFIYAHDSSDKVKQKKGKEFLGSIFGGEIKGVVSNQILGEMFHVMTSNMKKRVDVLKVKKVINAIVSSDNWTKIDYTHLTVKRATNYVEKFGIHFWDALIAATMFENNIFTIYTENEKDFKKVPGIKVINPLR